MQNNRRKKRANEFVISIAMHLALFGLLIWSSLYQTVEIMGGGEGEGDAMGAVMVDTGSAAQEWGRIQQQKKGQTDKQKKPEPVVEEKKPEPEPEPNQQEIAKQEEIKRQQEIQRQKELEKQKQQEIEKQKQQQDLLSSLKEGTEVMTIGGIKGTIAFVGEDYVEIRVDKGVKLTFRKSAIANVINNNQQ